MKLLLGILLNHGYWVLFGTVFAEQIGAPLPAIPVLLAMGALAGLGHFSLSVALAGAVFFSVAADTFWFEVGRYRGMSVLRLLCRISLEPDSCVTNTQTTFDKQGARALLIAKFVPGLSTMAPPMAGMAGMDLATFIALDAVGAFLWAGAGLFAGWVFRNQLEAVEQWSQRFGAVAGTILGLALAAYIGWKLFQRAKFMRSLRVARITPDELWEKIENGQDVVVVDLRNAIEQAGPRVPGAILLRFSDLDERLREIPRDRDVILYCT